MRETVSSAERYADRVRAKGFEPYIVKYETTRVKYCTGSGWANFKERSRADELARAYEQKGGSDFLVVRTEQHRSANRQARNCSYRCFEPVQGLMAEEVLSPSI